MKRFLLRWLLPATLFAVITVIAWHLLFSVDLGWKLWLFVFIVLIADSISSAIKDYFS